MERIKTIIIVAAALLLQLSAFAQQGAYKVNVSDKTISLAGLDLPGTTPLIDVLNLIPELLTNSDQGVNSAEYDILIDGISVDRAGSSVLNHMFLSDIKSISVSDSPTASQQRNGTGGVINIILNEVPDGWSGRASLNVVSASNYRENTMLNFHKDKLTVRSWFLFDTNTPGFGNEYRTLDTDNGYIYRIDTVRTQAIYQMFRVNAEYKLTAKDVFKLRFWESTQSTDNIKYMQAVPTGENDAGGRNIGKTANIGATLAYAHAFSKDESLNAQFDYLYLPEHNTDERRNALNVYAEPRRTVETLSQGYNLKGTVSYKRPLVVSSGDNILDFRTGVNSTYKWSKNQYAETVNLTVGRPKLIDGDTVTRLSIRDLYLSPYVEFGGAWSTLSYKASARYQYNQNTTYTGLERVTTYSNDVTCNLSVAWQIATHHHLRLVLDRGIIRPADWQMNPTLVYRPDKASHIIGNPDLVSSKLNSAKINYNTDIQKRNSTILINGSLGIIHADGLINTVYGVTNIGMLLPYISYVNAGTSNILTADLMGSYRNGPLMLTLSSNLFSKLQNMSDTEDFRKYYNCSLGATYCITPDWTVFAEMVYNSPILMPTIEHSSTVNGKLCISKAWEKLEAFAVVSNISHKTRREVAKSRYMTSYRYYDIFGPSLMIGFSYKF